MLYRQGAENKTIGGHHHDEDYRRKKDRRRKAGRDHRGKGCVHEDAALRMNKLAKDQKRTMAKTVDATNEKYIFRIWLLALGMGGDEFKTARRVLLKPLSGSVSI